MLQEHIARSSVAADNPLLQPSTGVYARNLLKRLQKQELMLKTRLEALSSSDQDAVADLRRRDAEVKRADDEVRRRENELSRREEELRLREKNFRQLQAVITPGPDALSLAMRTRAGGEEANTGKTSKTK